jgi:hypothetical protein
MRLFSRELRNIRMVNRAVLQVTQTLDNCGQGYGGS